MLRIITLVFGLWFGLGTIGWSATYYVGPASSGNASGSSRSNLKSLSAAKSDAEPGDIFLLQGGNYGSITIDAGYGAASNWVTYRRDPDTTADPRGPNWYEDETDVTRPNAASGGNYVVFTGLNIAKRNSGNAAVGQYIMLDGLSLLESCFYLEQYVAYVTIKNSCVFGRLFENITHQKYPEMTHDGVSINYWDTFLNEYHHVLVDSCYFEWLRIGVAINSRCGDEVVISNSHFYWMQNGSFSLVNFDHPSADLRVEGNHCHAGFGIADGAIRGTWSVAAAGSPALQDTRGSGTGSGARGPGQGTGVRDRHRGVRDRHKLDKSVSCAPCGILPRSVTRLHGLSRTQ